MNAIQIIAALSLALAVVASLLCAARLRNWRHPILLIGLTAFGLFPGLLRMDNDSLQGGTKSERVERREPTIEDLVHARYVKLRGEYATRHPAAD